MRITINPQTPELNQYQIKRNRLNDKDTFFKATRKIYIAYRGAKMRVAGFLPQTM